MRVRGLKKEFYDKLPPKQQYVFRLYLESFIILFIAITIVVVCLLAG